MNKNPNLKSVTKKAWQSWKIVSEPTVTTGQIYKGHTVEIVFSGAPGWFDFYIDEKPRGCDRAHKINQRVREIIDSQAEVGQ